jgi:small-conductance mechanosensitive channel
MVGNKFDVSAYCQEPLVTALDHLSSVKFALFSLIRPALKIAARSLFVENETITFSNILLHLNSDAPIAEPPPEARPQRPKRSFSQRIIHFFLVGIPLAIIVGILAGIINFIKNITNDIITVITIGSQLYSMSQRDVKFYKDNPNLLPPRNIAIDGVINTGLSFYTRRLIYKKLGMFSFLAKPFMTFIERILTNRVIKFCDVIDHYRNRYNDNNQTNRPSAPPPPYYNEKPDDYKYD